jgi:retron-type reverse transcriptase
MSSFAETRVDFVEFVDQLKHPDLPLFVDDMTLAHLLGVHNRTLWWMIWTKKKDMYEVFGIPKRGKSGGKRGIQNPVPKLKAVQRLILGKILEKIPVGDHIGAYIPGRSCMDTATQHLQKSVIVSIDIKDFFPSVKRSMIRRYLKSCGYNHLTASMLSELMTYKNFVPQGAPTSGLIANLVADHRFDQNIISGLKRLDEGWLYTRYSDDIDVSHPQDQPREKVQEVIDLVKESIEHAGFKLNSRKTKVEPRWRRQKVLGVVVNEKPNLPRLEYDRLRCLIHNCLMHGFESQYKRAGQSSANGLKSHIRGKLSFLKQIDEAKSNKLKTKFEIAEEIHKSPEEEVSFA